MFSNHPVIEFMWWVTLCVAALGLVSWVLGGILDVYNHFKTKREIDRMCRDAVIQAKIERIKQEVEEAAPKPWIY